jgi:hypothetical protein
MAIIEVRIRTGVWEVPDLRAHIVPPKNTSTNKNLGGQMRLIPARSNLTSSFARFESRPYGFDLLPTH